MKSYLHTYTLNILQTIPECFYGANYIVVEISNFLRTPSPPELMGNNGAPIFLLKAPFAEKHFDS